MKLHLLRVSGSAYEMGFAHGNAALQAGTLGSIDYYSSFIEKLFSFQAEGFLDRAGRAFLSKWVKGEVANQFKAQIPQYSREMMEGFSKGSDVPMEKLIPAYLMPDVYSYLVGKKYGFMNLGCTSFVWRDLSNSGNGFLHGRNLDYVGGDIWNRAPAVVEYSPKNGFRYASITSLGIDTAGITSTNEHGISISLHLNYSTQVSKFGIPIVMIGNEVIRRTKKLKEATEMLTAFSPTAGWSFLISSYKENQAAIVQMNSKQVFIQPIHDYFGVLTNHFFDSPMQTSEFWFSPLRKQDSLDRFIRAKGLFSQQGGKIPNVQTAVQILADSTSPSLQKEIEYGGTLCQVHTVTSAVFDPKDRKVFVATGDAPLSKRTFEGIALFDGPLHTEERVSGAIWNAEQEAREWYGKAYGAYFPERDMKKVIFSLQKACELQKDSHLYTSMLAMSYLIAKEFVEAKNWMKKALELKGQPYALSQSRFYLARILDVMNQREEANLEYEKLISDTSFSRRAQKGLRSAWTSKKLNKLFIDFTLGDVIET